MKNIIFGLTFLILLFVEPFTGKSQSATNLIPQSVCNPPCFNINFQSGTLNGWNAYYATDSSTASSIVLYGQTGGPAGSVTQAGGPNPNTNNSYHVQLKTSAGADPIAGALIPYTPPLGGLSAMIGDGPGINNGVGILEQTYLVDASAPILTVQYAVVLEYSAGDLGFQRPWFKMEVLDQNGVPITGCGQYLVVSGPGLPGFTPVYYAPHGDTVYCRPWTTAFVPLNNYIGQCVTLRFTAADCSLGTHFGYAYVSATCTKIDLVSTNSFCTGTKSSTITGPPGAAAYKWSTTGGCIFGPTNKQSVTTTCCGTYSLIAQSSAGPQCVDTFSVMIPCITAQAPTPCLSATRVCAGSPTNFNASCSNPFAGTKFYWDFYNSGTYNDSSGATPAWTYNTGGTYIVRLHILAANGCDADTSISVIVDSYATTLIPSFTYTVNSSTVCGPCNGKITLDITCGSMMDTLRTSFDSTRVTFQKGVAPTVIGGVKNCDSTAGSGYLTLKLMFCNLCPGVYQFYIIPSSPTPPGSCQPPGYYGDTIKVIVSPYSPSPPVLNVSNDTIFCTHAVSYQWYFNGLPISGATDSFYVATQSGTYKVFAIDTNGCGTFINITVFVGISSLQSEGVLNVHPNPAGNELWIESSEMMINNSKVTIELYNILGEQVSRTQPITQNPPKDGSAVADSKLKTAIDVSSLAKGIYILQVDVGSKVFRTKVVKQ